MPNEDQNVKQITKFEQFGVNGWNFEQEMINFNSLIYHFPSSRPLKAQLASKQDQENQKQQIIVPLHYNYDYASNKQYPDQGNKYYYDYFLINKQISLFTEANSIDFKDQYAPVIMLGTQVITFTFSTNDGLQHYVFPYSSALLKEMWFINRDALQNVFIEKFAKFFEEALNEKNAQDSKKEAKISNLATSSSNKYFFCYNFVTQLSDEQVSIHNNYLNALEQKIEQIIKQKFPNSQLIFNYKENQLIPELDPRDLKRLYQQMYNQSDMNVTLTYHSKFCTSFLSHNYATNAHYGLGQFTSFTYYKQILLNRDDNYKEMKAALTGKDPDKYKEIIKKIVSYISEGVVKVKGSKEEWVRFPFPIREKDGEISVKHENIIEYLERIDIRGKDPENKGTNDVGKQGELMWLFLGTPVVGPGSQIQVNPRSELTKKLYLGLSWFNDDYTDVQNKGEFHFKATPLTFVRLPYSDLIKE